VAGEEVVRSRRVFDGKLIGVRVDAVRLENGEIHDREVVEHPGAVGVLPVLPDGRVALVRQYRHPVGRSLLEIPAGTREPSEPPEETARRELIEETGFHAGSLEPLVRFYVSPGWADEQLWIYLATSLKAGTARPEADEALSLELITADQIVALIQRGDIGDAKTIVALLGWRGIPLKPR
jgi:ADP-ribose pyrophosphatase